MNGNLARNSHPLLPLIAGIVALCALAARADTAPPPFRVAVVDVFGPAAGLQVGQGELVAEDAADIDGDGLRDPVWHGDLVSLYVRDEAIATVPFPVRSQTTVKRELLAHLRDIHRRNLAGDRFDAVMFCWESSTLISAFADTLRPADRDRYQETARRWGETSESWRLTHEIILALEQLVDDGLWVVTIAGNSGPRWVNTYTFARGVIVVGASESDPDREWAVCNPLITTRAQSRYAVKLVSETSRPVFGYDIDEDGIADIPLRVGSSQYRNLGLPRETHRILKGTSFAAPTALKRMVASRTP